jgi:hypothetical protein
MNFKQFLSEKYLTTIKTAHSDSCEVYKNPTSIGEIPTKMWRGITVGSDVYIWDYAKGFHEGIWKRVIVPQGVAKGSQVYGFVVNLDSKIWDKGAWVYDGGWQSSSPEFYDKEEPVELHTKISDSHFRNNPVIVNLFGKLKNGTGDKRDMLYAPLRK